MRHLTLNFISSLVLVVLLLSLFVAQSGTGVCLASAPGEHIVGNACTAEAISMATVWFWSETTTALPAQKLLVLVAILVAVTPATFLRTLTTTRGLTWFNRRLNLARGGPSPNNEFLPYLFATHGW